MKKPGPRSAKRSRQIEKHFGHQMRDRRLVVDMSQSKLGQELGISFQQVQKYEKGINRISAARLYEVCLVLDIPIASMFEGIPRTDRKKKPPV
jgi:transcriptional regulator with XRE-family HTH domain